MPEGCSFSRRHFLRTTFGAAALRSVVPWRGPGLVVGHSAPTSADSVVVARLKLDRELYEAEGVLSGDIYFRKPPAGEILVRWIDCLGRVVEEVTLPAPPSVAEPQRFSFHLSNGLAYANWVELLVGGVKQVEGAKFLLSPKPTLWDDFHAIVWATYPDGFYGLLEDVGIDATIAYRDGDFTHVLDNNFNFYVEQLAWEVFALYHKRQELWKGLVEKFQSDRENWKLLARNPCVNDPKTDEYLREQLTRFVRLYRAFRPLYYNIADELGHGDQIKPVDFCHSKYCTVKFSECLRQLYGSLDRLGGEWGGAEVTRWDDETLGSGSEWEHSDLMIARTTTDRAFDSIALAGLETKYGGVARFNREWGTSFPEPTGVGMSAREEWEPVMGLVREARSIPALEERNLEQKLGPLEAANVRWGKRGGWKTEERPTRFKSWSEVTRFLKRFYAELAEIRSTDGWNVAPWCDFRNFMDSTFAAAVRRAAAFCKAEDPKARCATEGGQAPSAFGWYNYEQVLKAVDVIEPYNIGNNVEIIRSLNPGVIMLATHGFGYYPGKPLTPEDRVEQKRKARALWWQLFHGQRGAIIWDNHEPNFAFIDTRTRQLTPAADAFAGAFSELHSGIAKLILNSRRTHDGIAIHYSHPSLQVHWLLENVKHARDWMVNHVGDRGSRFIALRNSLTKLIEDLGFQYEFVSREQIESGKLARGEFRVFCMPESIAVSPREAEQIREFVRAGGLLVADYRAATMNEHGRDLGRGQLDDVFGIGRAPGQTEGRTIIGVANDESLHLAGASLSLRGPADLTIRAGAGKALARSGDVPLLIVNRLGNGRAIFLNLDLADYAYQRLQVGALSNLPEILENILSWVEIRPRVRVLGADGKRLPGTEVVIFSNGACEHVAVFRNPQFDDGGWGDNPLRKAAEWNEEIDNSLLEKAEEARIEWPTARETYDVRRRADLGALQTYQTTLDPWSPIVLTRASERLAKIGLAVATQARVGRPLDFTLTHDGTFPEATARVIRLEFRDPGGNPYNLYARNILVRSSPHDERIPFAYGDPKGTWRVTAHDLMTGQIIQAAFDLT